MAAILEGKSMPSNMAANISLKCVSSQISGVREFLWVLSSFGNSKITTHCLRKHWSCDLLVQVAYCDFSYFKDKDKVRVPKIKAKYLLLK